VKHAAPPLAIAALALVQAAASASPPAWSDGRNLAPNAGFAGDRGLRVGSASGTVPDCWRAFAVGGGAASVSVIPVPPGAIFPGSPATNAIRLKVSAFGTDQGFDHDNARCPIRPNESYHFEVYVRTANADGSDQRFNVSFPLFDSSGNYLRREPGGRSGLIATKAWTRFVGPSFSDGAAALAHIGFRVHNDAGEDAILVALPLIPGGAGGYGFAPHTACELAQRPTWTSQDRLVATTYFYWYRWPDRHIFDDGAQTDDALTDHPVEIEKANMLDKAWHRKEVADMVAAGIDMLWPVYWAAPGNFDSPHFSTYVEGLVPLQEALDELAAEGMRVPRVGMFYDTTSLLNGVRGVHPPDGKADLRTPEGKELFYQTIRSFFCMIHPRHWACIDGRPVVTLYAAAFAEGYDQSTFTYLSDRFAEEFDGIRPYVIRERSWQVATDSSFAWGAALNGPQLDGIAAIGPGYDDSAVPGRTTPYRMREDGAFYRWSWLSVLRSPARLVHIETWSEWHEGTQISETIEDGRLYIDLTAQYAAHFKAGTIPPERVTLRYPSPIERPADPDDKYAYVSNVQIFASGRLLVGEGIDPVPTPDGSITVAAHAGTSWLRTDIGPDRTASFAVKDTYHHNTRRRIEILLDYLDLGSGAVRLEYDSFDPAAGPARSVPAFTLEGSGCMRTWTTEVYDARFAGRQQGGADLSLRVATGPLYFKRMRVRVRPLDQPSLRVVAVDPPPGATTGTAPAEIRVTFNIEPDPASVHPLTFQLTGSGGDRIFGNGNDVPIVPAGVFASGTVATLDLTGVLLPPDSYEIRLRASAEYVVADTLGRTLDGAFRGSLPSGDGLGGTDFACTFDYVKPPIRCDFDYDGDVDVRDFTFFQICFNGPGRPPRYSPCSRADLDGDGDIDVTDFAVFQVCFNGPDRPPACE